MRKSSFVVFEKRIVMPMKQDCKSEASPSHLHRISIASPSHLHRLSIETMEYRWIIDGLSMDYLRRKIGGKALSLRVFA